VLSACAAAIAFICFAALFGGLWLVLFVLAVGAGYVVEALAVSAFLVVLSSWGGERMGGSRAVGAAQRFPAAHPSARRDHASSQ